MAKCEKCGKKIGFLSEDIFRPKEGGKLTLCDDCYDIAVKEEKEKQERKTPEEKEEQESRIQDAKKEQERRMEQEKELQEIFAKKIIEEREQKISKLTLPEAELLTMIYETSKNQEGGFTKIRKYCK
jgi:ribosome-binding protein aMBF1 (putative translation factor)